MEASVVSCDLLLTGGHVITVDDDRRVFGPGAVAIRGNRIVGVGTAEELSRFQAKRTVDCTDKAVLPGFTDCHTHFFQTLARGLGDGFALWPWLCEFMWPYALTINQEEARVAATLAAVQAARTGTTAVVDNHYAPNDLQSTLAVASAIDAVGIRAAVARGIVGPVTEVARRMGLTPELFGRSNEEELDITEACMEVRPPGGRVVVWPAPLNVIYVNQELFARSIELARRFGTGWHTHCSEGEIDPRMYLEVFGIRPVDWLFQEGLLGTDATLAHSIWLDDREIERVGATASGASYNPVSNQYIGCGTMRLRELRSAGAVVGLGTDGSAVTGRDMFEVMKQAALLQRATTGDPTASNADEAIEMATREGARYHGIDAGILAEGRLADLVVVDLDRPHLRPVHEVVPTLVYLAMGADVVMTIVDGEIVYEDDRCTRIDEDALLDEAQARAEELVLRARSIGLRLPRRWDETVGAPEGSGERETPD
jgi:5-methylthioadenosine/S-adenosylhomocysteine deaminase